MENQDLILRIEALEKFVKSLTSNDSIPLEVGEAMKIRVKDLLPNGIENAPRPAITSPSGGITIDSEARAAINSIITALEAVGLIQT